MLLCDGVGNGKSITVTLICSGVWISGTVSVELVRFWLSQFGWGRRGGGGKRRRPYMYIACNDQSIYQMISLRWRNASYQRCEHISLFLGIVFLRFDDEFESGNKKYSSVSVLCKHNHMVDRSLNFKSKHKHNLFWDRIQIKLKVYIM